MRQKSIAVLLATFLTIAFLVTAWNSPPARAAPKLWTVYSGGGYNFLSLTAALASLLLGPSDRIQVQAGHVEPPLLGNMIIPSTLSNLWILGPDVGTSPKIDVNGFSIVIQANGVFIWGLNVVNTGVPTTALYIGPGVTGSIIMNNTITGNFAPNFVGITVDNAANNLIANNTMSFWDSCMVVEGLGSTGNRIELNTLNAPSNKGIWLSSLTGTPPGPPNSNSIYWNNIYSVNELWDDFGNPQNYFDDKFPGGPNGGVGWIKGNYLFVHEPLGGPPYLVPPNNAFFDNHPLGPLNLPLNPPPPSVPIKQIPGDINLDGRVDILDAILLANNFLNAWGQYAWNPRADVVPDNVINILDAIVLAVHWGQHY
jgi:hypothetical protein